jgi:glyoxylase-like metal-dependent hydrolase (beta-lactamase superfamily II)
VTGRDVFEVQRFPHGVIMIREADDREEVAFYLVSGSRDAAIIDTGLGGGDLPGLVARLTCCRPVILQTHRHWDHIGASSDFADVRVHAAELAVRRVGWPWEPPDETGAHGDSDGDTGRSGSRGPVPGVAERVPSSLHHGDRIDLGGRVLEVIHTPGHSPGSVSFLDREARALFVGDLCYLGQMLLFVSASDMAAFRRSLHALGTIAADVDAIYPAHGSAPMTSDYVLHIRDAFEFVWSGKKPDWHGTYSGHRVAIHDFGRFAFLVPPG